MSPQYCCCGCSPYSFNANYRPINDKKFKTNMCCPAYETDDIERLQNKYNDLPGQVQIVILHRHQGRLGLSLAGNKDRNKLSVFIVGITSEDAKKEVMVGDEILEVDNHVLFGRSHLNASSILKNLTSNEVKLIILRRDNGGIEDMAIKPLSSNELLHTIEQYDEFAASTGEENLEKEQMMITSQGQIISTSPKKLITTPPKLEEKYDLLTCPIVPDTPTMIHIDKKEQPLGLSLTGGKDTLLGSIMIEEVHRKGAAERDGRLKVDDLLLEVNGENLRKATLNFAKECIYQPQSHVTFLVLRNSNVEQFIQDYYDFLTVDMNKKQGKSLGISIKDRSVEPRVIVTHIVKGSPAELDGHVKPGDQILEINHKDVTEYGQEDVALLLKSLVGKITFKLRRLRPATGEAQPSSKTPLTEKLMKLKLSSDSLQDMMSHHGKFVLSKPHAQQPPGSQVAPVKDIGNISLVNITRHGEEIWGIRFSGTGGGISSQTEVHEPVSVGDIVPGGLVEGRLKKGDRILSINGQSLENMSLNQANTYLNGLKGSVSFEIVKASQPSQSSASSAAPSPG